MSAVWLIVGLVVGAGVTALIMRERIRAARLTLSEVETTLKAHTGDTLQNTLQAALSQLSEQNRAQFATTQAEAKGELEKRQHEIQRLVTPLADGLKRMDQQITSLGKDQSAARGQMSEQMRALAQLRQETGSLATAMARPNSRGQWGQLQLRRVVELAGMVEHVDFEEQVSFHDHQGNMLRPDMFVSLPGDKRIPVDAKAPPLPTLSPEQARDAGVRLASLQAHARGLKSHVNQLAGKEYWSRLDGSPDFVVMFLPGEHVYSAALEADPSLMEYAMGNRVLIATPTTLLALLHSAAYGWQQQRVAESARAIAVLGRDLHSRLGTFAGKLAKVGRGLSSAVNAYNDAVGSYESRLLVTARRFGELGAVAEGSELPELERVDVAARPVTRAFAGEDEAPPPLSLLEGGDGLAAGRL
jgi:DNA recombination protein RmuC